MPIVIKATVKPMPLPLVLEKGGQRYQLDLVDDSTGIDLNITKVETTEGES